MKLKFKSLDNEFFEIPYDDKDNVIAIKIQLNKECKIDPKNIKLLIGNRVLDDNMFIKDINFYDQPILFCRHTVDRSKKDIILKVCGHSWLPGLLQIARNAKISDISQTLQTICGKFSAQFVIFESNGSRLSSDMSINSLNLEDDSKIIAIEKTCTKGKLTLCPILMNHESLEVEFSLDDTMGQIKARIEGLIKKNSDDFVLFLNDVCLPDNGKLVQFCDLLDAFPPVLHFACLKNLDDVQDLQVIYRGRFTKIFTARTAARKDSLVLKGYRLSRDGRLDQFSWIMAEILSTRGLIDHPRIIQIFDLYRDKKFFYLRMEHMEKQSLKEYMAGRPLSEREIGRFSHQIVEGLVFLHENKVIHKDLKCSSVLVDSQDSVKLSSFGLSRYHRDKTSSRFVRGIMDSFASIEQYNWLAPEIIRNETFGVKVDIWSLGTTLIEMSTGRPPFHGSSPFDIVQKITAPQVDWLPPSTSISDNLKDLIDQCLQPEASRPKSDEILSHAFFGGDLSI